VELRNDLERGPHTRKFCGCNRVWAFAVLTVLDAFDSDRAQWASRDGWVEEPVSGELLISPESAIRHTQVRLCTRPSPFLPCAA